MEAVGGGAEMLVLSPPLLVWGGGERARMGEEVSGAVDIQVVIAVLTFLGVVAAVTGLVPLWVPFLEKRPHVVRRVGRPLRGLRQWWRVVFAAVVVVLLSYVVWSRPEVWLVGLVAAVVFLLLWFIRELAKGISWLGRAVLWKAIIRPARDHFGVEAHEEADGITPALTDLLRDRLRGLDADSLWVLEGALARRKPGSNEAVLEYPDGMRLEPRESGAGMAKPRFEKALDKLKSVGAISSWGRVGTDTARNFSIRVVVPTADWRTLERLRVAAELERTRQKIREEMQEALVGQESGSGSNWTVELSSWVRKAHWDSLMVLNELMERGARERALIRVRWPDDHLLEPAAASWSQAGTRLTAAFDEIREIGWDMNTSWSDTVERITIRVTIGRIRPDRVLVLRKVVVDEMLMRRTKGTDR